MGPTVLSLIKSRLPNSTRLYQILPVGIPSVIVLTLIGRGYSHWIESSVWTAADSTRTIFVLMAVPGFIIGLVKLFGRQPKSGDVRWYTRPRFSLMYRIFGPVLFTIAFGLIVGVI